MTTETLQIELSASHTNHSNDKYSISIDVRNAHTSLSSHSYPHIPGTCSDLVIYGLTVPDIKALSQAILTEALKIEMEDK